MSDYGRRQITKGRLVFGDGTTLEEASSNDSLGVKFQYNPAEFSDALGNNWTEVRGAGMSYPVNVYSGGKQRFINFVIELDGVADPPAVRRIINYLHSFIPPARTKGYQFISPPSIIFAFGWFVKECLLDDMKIDYIMFTPDLQPLRANINLSLRIVQ